MSEEVIESISRQFNSMPSNFVEHVSEIAKMEKTTKLVNETNLIAG